MIEKTIPYVLLGVAIVVFTGTAFYFVAGRDAFPFRFQESPQSVLPKPVHGEDVVPSSVTSEPEDMSSTDSIEEVETVEVKENSAEQEEEQKVSEPSPVVPEKPERKPMIHPVSIEANAFVPQTLFITVGDTVRWVNNDTQLHWPASDPHPTHTGTYGLDPLADLLPGEAFSFTFTQEGSFGYHDHTQAVINDEATITGVVGVLPRD